MKQFTFQMPTQVLFGEGCSENLDAVIEKFSAKHVLLITGKNTGKTAAFQNICKGLTQKNISYDVFDDTKPEPPVEAVDEAVAVLRERSYDMAVAVGGGSVIDSAKAICMLLTNEGSVRDYLFGGTRQVEKRPIPLVCIPTTAGSGSEVTASSVISETRRGVKLSITHPWLTPQVAVIDPLVHQGMPKGITASTGMDALTHAIEAYVSKNAEPLSDAFAAKAICLIGKNLYQAFTYPDDLEARANMALASVMAAAAFLNAGLGAVHGISQSIGGIAHVPHGVGNALLLPHVCQTNIPGNVQKFSQIGAMLDPTYTPTSQEDGARHCIACLTDLLPKLELPTQLHQVGVTREMFPKIVEESMAYRLLPLNPVAITQEDVLDILERAY